MKKQQETISVVIPNYNGSKLLKKFLPSVFADLRSEDEVIIVDDASTDDSVASVIKKYELKKSDIEDSNQVSEKYFPHLSNLQYEYYTATISYKSKNIRLKFLALKKNVRFAAAVNTGVLLVENNFFFLLNNDVEVVTGCREALLSTKTDTTFAVGCLEYEDEIGGEKSGKNKLWFEKGIYMHSKADEMKSGSTAWVSGGSGLFNTKKWIQLDGFDQLFYPAYWEDIDISFRARKNGWDVLFEENAVVLHKHESTNTDVYGTQKMLSMSWKNADAFVKKNGSFLQLIQYVLWKPYWNRQRAKHLDTKVQL